MKLLILFLIIIYSSTTIVNSSIINFIGSYSDNKCSDLVDGIGYSIKTGVCVSNMGNLQIDDPFSTNEYNFILTIQGSNTLIVQQYLSYKDAGCDKLVATSNLKLNQCNQIPNFQGIYNSNYTSISSTEITPQYIGNSVVVVQYEIESGNSQCENADFLYATTYTNGYQFQAANGTEVITSTYYCKNSTPYVKNCNADGICQTSNVSSSCNDAYQSIFCS